MLDQCRPANGLVSHASIEEAARTIAPVAVRTPLLRAHWLEDYADGEIRLKCENLQRTASFKFRGAYNTISRLSDDQRRRGVVCYSAGNHAQAVALSARLLGIPAVVVMPANVVKAKADAVAHSGAEIVLAGTSGQDRQQEAERIATSRGLALVPPFDHYDIIAGQGTVAREILEDWPEVEAILVPTAGGGLLGGVGAAAKYGKPSCQVIGVEPELAGPMGHSLRQGRPVTIDRADTRADGLRIEYVSDLTFRHAREFVDAMVQAGDHEIDHAVTKLMLAGKLVVEPSGAITVAAILAKRWQANGRPTALILSGGNADPSLLGERLR